jgi:uncharacterized protein (DUF433 family)
MEIRVEFSPEIAAALAQAAASAGKDPEQFIRDTMTRAVRRDHVQTLDWSQCPAVESIPGKVSGAWVLKGTRMPVATIFENLEAGANIDNIMEWFDGLDREQVKAVIDFAARSLNTPPRGR